MPGGAAGASFRSGGSPVARSLVSRRAHERGTGRLRRPPDAVPPAGRATFDVVRAARPPAPARPTLVSPLVVRFLVVLLGLAVALFLVVVALAWRYQERIVWQPPGGGADWTADDSTVREVRYAAADGQPLLGYLVEPTGAPAAREGRVLVAFHGNAETAAWGIVWAREVEARTGWRVLVP